MPKWTSGAAHRAGGKTRRPSQRIKVLQFIKDRGTTGATLDEVQEFLGLVSSVGSRITELRRLGAIEDSGKTRLTRSGSHATVWVLSEEARKRLALRAST